MTRLKCRVRCAWSAKPASAAATPGCQAAVEQPPGQAHPELVQVSVRRQAGLRAEGAQQHEWAHPGHLGALVEARRVGEPLREQVCGGADLDQAQGALLAARRCARRGPAARQVCDAPLQQARARDVRAVSAVIGPCLPMPPPAPRSARLSPAAAPGAGRFLAGGPLASAAAEPRGRRWRRPAATAARPPPRTGRPRRALARWTR
jgi:hypothetical protein